MYDHDAVIRLASECAVSHAGEVSTALCRFVGAKNPSEHAQAQDALRVALVAQAAGFEGVAHDGSTYQRRVDAAKAALVAWDGPAEGRGIIRIGSRIVRCDITLAVQAGWGRPYADSIEIRPAFYYPEQAAADLAMALDAGLNGDDAVMRALVLRRQRIVETEIDQRRKAIAETESKAAGMHLAAEREVTKRQERAERASK